MVPDILFSALEDHKPHIWYDIRTICLEKGRKRGSDQYDESVQVCGRLMSISHQMRSDIGPWFYGSVEFHIIHGLRSPPCARFFGSLSAFTQRQLQRLSITLNDPESPVRPTGYGHLTTINPLVSIVVSLPNLRHLRVRFEGIRCNPLDWRVVKEWYYPEHDRYIWKWRNFDPPQSVAFPVATLSDFDPETLILLQRLATVCPQLKYAYYSSRKPLFQNHVDFAADPTSIRSFCEVDSVSIDLIAGYTAMETKHAQLANIRDYFERAGLLKKRSLVNAQYLCSLLYRIMEGENYYDWEFWIAEDGEVKETSGLTGDEKTEFKPLGKGTVCVSKLRNSMLSQAKDKVLNFWSNYNEDREKTPREKKQMLLSLQGI